MKLSIIVPAYNAEETLALCLQSLLDLNFPKDQREIILVDNNSFDKTYMIASQFPEVIYVREKKQGRSYARNKGAFISTGEYLAFIDADVFLDKEWAKEALLALSTETLGGGQGPIIPADVDGKTFLNKYRQRSALEATNGSNNLLYLAVKESPMINSAACLYRKVAFNAAGGFDPTLKRHEDIDLSKRVLYAGYDLTIMEKSVAHVSFNGNGWPYYFKRSFEDGFTKGDYLLKWRDLLFVNEKSIKESNFRMFSDEVLGNFLRGVYRFDRYYFIKALNSTLKSFGRICSIFTNRNIKPFKLSPEEKAPRYVFYQNRPVIEFDLNKKHVKTRL